MVVRSGNKRKKKDQENELHRLMMMVYHELRIMIHSILFIRPNKNERERQRETQNGKGRKNYSQVLLHAYSFNNFTFNFFIVVLIQFAYLHITPKHIS